MSARPRVRPYGLILATLAAAWVAYSLFRSYQQWELTGLQDPNMGSGVRSGLLAIVVIGAIGFIVHWILNATSTGPTTVAPSIAASADSSSSVNSDVARVLAGTGEKYALEIRAVGLAEQGRYQDAIWEQIKQRNNNYVSILSADGAKEYGENADLRRTFSKVDTTAAFQFVASEAVHYWPVPVIILGPPKGPEASTRAAFRIADGRNGAGLGVTEFLWLDDRNTATAAPAISELFDFFDRHPDVPAALLLAQDGMQHRWTAKTPGAQPDGAGALIPSVPNSMAGLLVARTDRVDRLVRPYAVQVPGDIDKTTTQYDVIKLWNFYWDKDEQFQEQMDKVAGGFNGAFTMKADWWTAQLPELWKKISNKGPGDFKPSPYLPVRWTDWQLEQFDAAPRLGYLHRPVEIKLTGDDGKLLKRGEQAIRLQDGWKQAVAALPNGIKPQRVFYDTTLDREWVIPLTQALHGEAQGIDIGDVKEGYDIGRRIGNTGVSSALVQLCLATIAGYEDGGASATVNLIDKDSASIVMVSPPDGASKATNEKNRGANPFRHGLP